MNEARGPFYLGIDVGTGSARAGLFDADGRMHGTGKRDITLHRDAVARAEQSSEEIWQAVCAATRTALVRAGVEPSSIAGIGFDATCSLVVVGEGGAPLPVSPGGDPARDIIVWMDHRAVDQAGRINATGHSVLRYVGGTISPEMETPKLLWLKEHVPETYAAAWQFMDLTDFLTWRATGDPARSTCTVTCKWTYLAHEERWDPDFFRRIGLSDLADEGFARIGDRIVPPGTALGQGLSPRAAEELGLAVGIPVAAGLIDAHAGGLGTVGTQGTPQHDLAYVFGTSSCTMTSTHEPVFVPGVWGPYYSAMVPGMWLNEGGQSVAGAAIARLVTMHPATGQARERAEAEGLSLPDWLADRAAAEVADLSAAVDLARGLHVVPEFLGNRAPHADPGARALIAGLDMSEDLDSLVALYIAGLCGVGYGLRQIAETQNEAGAITRRIVISGGAGQSELVRQLLADATGIPVLSSRAEEPVLLGSAILGALAAGDVPNANEAMRRMSGVGGTYTPSEAAVLDHEKRYRAFLALQRAGREIRN